MDPWGGGRKGHSSAADVFCLFRECRCKWPLLCQMGSGYLYCVRRRHFCRTQCAQSPLFELEKEVWFHSGCGCQIYLKSSHVSSLFSSLVMAIFIILCFKGWWFVSLEKIVFSCLTPVEGAWTYLMSLMSFLSSSSQGWGKEKRSKLENGLF